MRRRNQRRRRRRRTSLASKPCRSLRAVQAVNLRPRRGKPCLWQMTATTIFHGRLESRRRMPRNFCPLVTMRRTRTDFCLSGVSALPKGTATVSVELSLYLLPVLFMSYYRACIACERARMHFVSLASRLSITLCSADGSKMHRYGPQSPPYTRSRKLRDRGVGISTSGSLLCVRCMS